MRREQLGTALLTVSVGHRVSVWGHMPMAVRTASVSVWTCQPPTNASPALAASMPVSIDIAVVFPAPFSPSNPRHSPRSTASVRSDTATFTPTEASSRCSTSMAGGTRDWPPPLPSLAGLLVVVRPARRRRRSRPTSWEEDSRKTAEPTAASASESSTIDSAPMLARATRRRSGRGCCDAEAARPAPLVAAETDSPHRARDT